MAGAFPEPTKVLGDKESPLLFSLLFLPAQSGFVLSARFLLQPGALPEHAKLSTCLEALRRRSSALAAAGALEEEDDFADVVLCIEGRIFR